MDTTKTFYVFCYTIIIIIINTCHAGFDDDIQALEKDLELEHMKTVQKKSVQDMTTEELIEELQRGMDKQAKKSHTERFHDIVEKTSSDDFEKLLSATSIDASETSLKKKSINTLHAESEHTASAKQSKDGTQKKSSDVIKEITMDADKTMKRESDESLVLKAIATMEELRKADVNDLTAQKKSVELLQQLMKADESTSRKRGASTIIDKIRMANKAEEKKETARFVAALNADTAILKKKADEQIKATKEKEEEDNKTTKKSLNQAKEVENKVEEKHTKGTLINDVLSLMAQDLVRQIADEVASESVKETHSEQQSDEYAKCEDTRTDCHRLLEYCDGHKAKLKNSCAKSCRFCEPCRDEWSGASASKCKIIVKQQMCPWKRVEKYCRKSCGYCKVPAPPRCSQTRHGCCWDKTTTKLNGRGSNCPDCKNEYKFVCDRFKMDCRNTNKAGSFMRGHCAQACGMCKDTCLDDPKKAFYCPYWKKDLKWCTERRDIMKYFCPSTCGFC